MTRALQSGFGFVLRGLGPQRRAVKVDGWETLERNLMGLPTHLARKANKAAIRKGARPIVNAAKRNVRVTKSIQRKRTRLGIKPRTNLLAKSLAAKIRGSVGQTRATAIIGPRTDVSGPGYGGKHVPANIAHLVELGHGGPKPAPPAPFLRPAYEEKTRESQRIIADELWVQIRKATVRPS